MEQLLLDIVARLDLLLSRLGAPVSEPTPDIDAGIRAYTELKGKLGGAEIAESLGLSKDELSAFERDLRDLGRRIQRSTAEDEPVVVRNRHLGALMVLSWFELLGERGLELPASSAQPGEKQETLAHKQVRALELLLRAVVTNSFGSQESLEQELRERFGKKSVDGWRRSGDPGDLLSGTTMGEVASLVAAKQMFPRYSHLFEVGETLAFLPDRRKSLQRFLEDVRRIRNVLAHNRRISGVQIQLLDHYFSEVTGPLQESYDVGELAVDPSQFLDISGEALGTWLEGLDESVQAVRDDVEDLRREVGERFDALQLTAGKTLETATGTSRKATWILAGVVILAVGMWGIFKKTDRIEGSTAELAEAAAEMTRTGEVVREEIGQIGVAVAELAGLGGLVASPKSPQEFIHNARALTASADYAGAREAYERFLEFDVPFADVAEEYVDAVVAAEGDQLAVPILVRQLDPSGSRLTVEDGLPVRSENGGAIGDAAVAVELAMTKILEGREQKLEWLESLYAIRPDYSPLLATLVRHHVSPVSLMVGSGSFDQDLWTAMPTRRAVGVARDCIEQFVALDSGHALEGCYLDELRARDARDYVGTVRKEVAALTDEYWDGQVAMHSTVAGGMEGTSNKSRIQVMFRVPQNVVGASLQVGEGSPALDLEIRKSMERSPGHWESSRPANVFEGRFDLPYWTTCVVPMYGADRRAHVLPATPETHQLVLSYVNADGQPSDPVEFSLDCGALLLAAAKDGLEGPGVFLVDRNDPSTAFSVKNPGVSYGASLIPSAEAARGMSPQQIIGKYPHWSPQAERHLPYLETVQAKDWAKDGFGLPWVRLQLDGASHEPITVQFDRLLFFRDQLRAIRYSLGQASLDQSLGFDPNAALSSMEIQKERSDLRLRLPDCFGGPLFVQVEYKDGATSQVVRYDLIDPSRFPEGKSSELVAESSGIQVFRDHYPDGAVKSVTRLREGGPVMSWPASGGKPPAPAKLVHGLQQEFYPNGQLASEALCAEGLTYAQIEWDEEGELELLACAAPIFAMETRFGGATSMFPSQTCRVGPYLKLTPEGELHADSGWYGRGVPDPVSEHMVKINDAFMIEPVDLTIEQGDTVKWVRRTGFGPPKEVRGAFDLQSESEHQEIALTFDGDFLKAHPRPENNYEYEFGYHEGSITVRASGGPVDWEPRDPRGALPTTELVGPLESEEISRFRSLTSIEELLSTIGDGVGLELRGQQHGWWRDFNDGVLVREGWLREGSRIGNWTEYHEGGSIRTRGGYAGSRVGLQVSWDKEGRVDYQTSGFMVMGALCVPRGHADHQHQLHHRPMEFPIVIDHGGDDPRYRAVSHGEEGVYKAPVDVIYLYPSQMRKHRTPPGMDHGLPVYGVEATTDADVLSWWRQVVDAEIDHRGWGPGAPD